jgi:hypothetical protein
MSRPLVLALATFLASFTLEALAQSRPPQSQPPSAPAPPPPRTTGPNLIALCLPGGKIAIDLKSITAIGLHSYTVDATSRVWELTVDNGGSSLLRIYSVSTISPNEPILDMAKVELESLAESVSKSVGLDVWAKVQKSYPTSTHAKTVEYRVKTVKELLQLRKLLFKAWTSSSSGRIDLSESTKDILTLDLEKF